MYLKVPAQFQTADVGAFAIDPQELTVIADHNIRLLEHMHVIELGVEEVDAELIRQSPDQSHIIERAGKAQ